jgi:nitroimidazol reductase NimA-like FMN-containing flavoprotein (pyridoxamine 5'-phosphate oxidase superfamily)
MFCQEDIKGIFYYSLPINFYCDEKDNRIYFHGSKEGHKVDAIKNNDKVQGSNPLICPPAKS